MPPPLILASASAARRAQLERLGLAVECVASEVDESVLKACRWPAPAIATRLALAKAQAVSRRRPGAVVIGGDQIACLDGETFDKPGDFENARRQLRRLSGRTHQLVTAAAVVAPERAVSHVETVAMTMRRLTDDEIDAYLKFDEPFDCAGCYKWESRGPLLFASVETSDPTAILGLPLLWLATTLRELGYLLP